MMSKAYSRKKPVVSGTISPLHKKKIDKLVGDGEFASVSDFISQAVTDFLSRYNGNPGDHQTISFTNADLELIRNIVHEEMETMDFKKTKE